ncbi:MAG TPA: DUF2231 domain-containing protein [Malonomonas sp.]
MEKVWRCVVCGYLHKGDRPPDECPVCHADASKFELVTEPAGSAASQPKVGLFQEMLDVFEPHAVSAHFPNALIPTTVLFLGLFVLLGSGSFETTAFYLLVVAVLSVPPTFGTGLYDWKRNYGGQSAPIFRKKIVPASCLSVLGLFAVIWRWQSPEVLTAGGWPAWLFLLVIAAMLGCVTLLGHYGGMLVFAKNGK